MRNGCARQKLHRIDEHTVFSNCEVQVRTGGRKPRTKRSRLASGVTDDFSCLHRVSGLHRCIGDVTEDCL